MAEIQVRVASCDDEVEAARELCRQWLDWHWKNYPPDWPRGADHPMDPDGFQIILCDLADLHKRPKGAILVAWVDSIPAGCVMYAEAGPETAELNRMFVNPAGRGHGLGQKLLDAMFDQMVADGYARAIFSSATFLTHARDMYLKAGFQPMTHPAGFPDMWRDKVYFMERALP